VTWLHGTAGALWLIAMRILQAVGGAMLLANAAAILTDAFPAEHRGMALGLNQVAGIAGQFAGLLLGGLLGPVEWHLVFLVSPSHCSGAEHTYTATPRCPARPTMEKAASSRPQGRHRR